MNMHIDQRVPTRYGIDTTVGGRERVTAFDKTILPSGVLAFYDRDGRMTTAYSPNNWMTFWKEAE